MLVMREETFGPLAAIARFEDEAEVMRLANDTEMGLAGYIYTRSHDRARRTSRSLQCGMIGVNASKITGAPVPFGGLKQSGYGREGSHHGLEQFTDLKYICEAFDAT